MMVSGYSTSGKYTGAFIHPQSHLVEPWQPQPHLDEHWQVAAGEGQLHPQYFSHGLAVAHGLVIAHVSQEVAGSTHASRKQQ
ncbi:unnamed protein product [Arctia plantaginis]|uniref:Uncharacterized protein n=1 Tax=Arctia plantaginis TaxID=874455 RepID=A0A8S1BIP0_ARCPL|nr:unnamed protein product [Arctia plantaginis]